MSDFRATVGYRPKYRVSFRDLIGAPPPNNAKHLVSILIDDPAILSHMGEIWQFGPTQSNTDLEVDVTGICPRTPNIAALAKKGRTFKNAYVQPVCSPCRASADAGVHVFRHGVSHVVRIGNAGALAEFGDPGFSFTALADKLRAAGIRCRRFGKMHLSIADDESFNSDFGNHTWDGRAGSGFGIVSRLGYGNFQTAEYSVTLRNLNQNDGYSSSGGRGYYEWALCTKERNEAPQIHVDFGYNPSVLFTELTNFFLSAAPNERLFADFRLNSIHTPYEPENFPPTNLVTTQFYKDHQGEANAFPVPMANMEAVDALLGAFMQQMETAGMLDEITFVIWGDNGTDVIPYAYSRLSGYDRDYGVLWNRLIDESSPPNASKWKDSPYRLGTNWPLMWSGPRDIAPFVANAGAVHHGLVDVVDVHATICEYFGAAQGAIDGKSFLQAAWNDAPTARTITLAEDFEPMGDWQTPTTFQLGAAIKIDPPIDGISGIVHYIQPDIGDPDRVYHLSELDGTDVDPWEDDLLDRTIFAALYAYCLQQVVDLHNSSLGGDDLFLPVTLRDGGEGHIAVDENGKIPFTLRDGSIGYFQTVDGRLPFTKRDGTTGYIPLEGNPGASGYVLEFELRNALGPFGPQIPMDPDGTIHFTKRDGTTGRLQCEDGGTTGKRLPIALRGGGTGYIELTPVT